MQRKQRGASFGSEVATVPASAKEVKEKGKPYLRSSTDGFFKAPEGADTEIRVIEKCSAFVTISRQQSGCCISTVQL
eukprot:12430717-Karenia_brevis.AAC.1